jgi:hypothetical protein
VHTNNSTEALAGSQRSRTSKKSLIFNQRDDPKSKFEQDKAAEVKNGCSKARLYTFLVSSPVAARCPSERRSFGILFQVMIVVLAENA